MSCVFSEDPECFYQPACKTHHGYCPIRVSITLRHLPVSPHSILHIARRGYYDVRLVIFISDSVGDSHVVHFLAVTVDWSGLSRSVIAKSEHSEKCRPGRWIQGEWCIRRGNGVWKWPISSARLHSVCLLTGSFQVSFQVSFSVSFLVLRPCPLSQLFGVWIRF